MPVLNRRSPYRNWRLDQSLGRSFTVNRDTWQYDGLVGLWTCFGQNRNIVALRDEIQHRDMTAFNTPTIASSKLGPVVAFDKASQEYLKAGTTPIIGHPFTLACWFYPVDVLSWYYLMSVGNQSVGNRFSALIAQGNVVGDPITAFSLGAEGSDSATTTAGFAAATWHHACGVFSANNLRAAYLDGQNKGTNSTTVSPSGWDNISIASSADSTPSSWLDGMISEARIYNRALSDAEAFALWAPSTRGDLYKPTARAFFMGPTAFIRTPRYGFTNFQIPGIV